MNKKARNIYALIWYLAIFMIMGFFTLDFLTPPNSTVDEFLYGIGLTTALLIMMIVLFNCTDFMGGE